jgi:hypothetical protein
VTNTPPAFDLGEYFYLEVPGIQFARARAMTADGVVLTSGYSTHRVYMPRSVNGLCIPRELLAAKSLILSLGFETNLVRFHTNNLVKFDEKGRLFTGKEPIWLSDFHLEQQGQLTIAVADIFFDPGSAIQIDQIEESQDFKTWVGIQQWRLWGKALWDDDHTTLEWRTLWQWDPPKFKFYRARYE